jgi:broad specificity phosphatase PhoE
MSGRLILIRHGESFGNRERYFAADPPQLALMPTG